MSESDAAETVERIAGVVADKLGDAVDALRPMVGVLVGEWRLAGVVMVAVGLAFGVLAWQGWRVGRWAWHSGYEKKKRDGYWDDGYIGVCVGSGFALVGFVIASCCVLYHGLVRLVAPHITLLDKLLR